MTIKFVDGQPVEMTPEEITDFEAARAVSLQQLQAEAVQRIDSDVDRIYAAVIGNRQAEYEAAEREAQAYADAGYVGDVPPLVEAWATAKVWTGAQAADDILTQAVAWRSAQAQIRAARLARKEQARMAADAAGVQAALAAWAAFVAAARAQLGVGGA